MVYVERFELHVLSVVKAFFSCNTCQCTVLIGLHVLYKSVACKLMTN